MQEQEEEKRDGKTSYASYVEATGAHIEGSQDLSQHRDVLLDEQGVKRFRTKYAKTPRRRSATRW